MTAELKYLMEVRDEERHERESLVLWRRPITTIHYFLLELLLDIQEYASK